MLIVGARGEIDIVAAIDGSSGFLHHIRDIGQLVDGRIVADHHTVETHIIAQDVLEDFSVGHTLRAVYGMVARHDATAACQPDHGFMGQQDFLHQLFLVGITATAIAQIMFGTGTNALFQIVLLESAHKGRSHDGRQIAILAIRLLQAVERRHTTHIDHRREG